MRSSMTKLRSTKKFEIVLDSNKPKWFYMSCAAALPQLDRGSDYESERHRFESYTPHQSNLKPPATGAFLLRRHRMDSNLGRGAGVKKTRSVFSPRASAPAGGRSRCGSAQRMRGILYAAPIELKALPFLMSKKWEAVHSPATGAFLLWQHRMDSNLGRGASVLISTT